MKKLSKELYDTIKWGKSDNHLKKVQSLIHDGADVNYKTSKKAWSMLHWCVYDNIPNILECLASNEAMINENNNKYNYAPIHLLPKRAKNTRCVEILVKHGANINIEDKEGLTALQHLLHPNTGKNDQSEKYMLQAEYLIKNGAITNPTNGTYHPIIGAVGIEAEVLVRMILNNIPPKDIFIEAQQYAIDLGLLNISELFNLEKQ
ncbi:MULTISPECIES: ankyrin repeat domain-containing protein [Aquimarina]|uniref:ankyrin repeat domain-containing protein n=1 Tax=Aquimarina TaxID=290174 RepID=UPI0009436026|nr:MULTISPECIES: ankyrin repeat domain-containing protein [Aquimarina]